MSKKLKLSTRHSLTIRSKVTLSRILKATSNSVRIEINEEGSITGRYTESQLDTMENAANPDGSSTWSGKFMRMINKGDMIVASGR